jgi:hypothetical protein
MDMRRFGLLLFAFFACCNFLDAQEEEKEGFELSRAFRFQRAILMIDYGGNLDWGFLYSDSSFGHLDICNDEVLLEEISTIDDQRQRFNQFVKRWRESVEDTRSDFLDSLAESGTMTKQEVEARNAEFVLSLADLENSSQRELREIFCLANLSS